MRHFILFALLGFSLVSTANNNETTTLQLDPIKISVKNGPSHMGFSALLKRYVSATGDVDYAGLKTEQNKLTAYLADLSANSPKAAWTNDEKLAYWINLYNAATLNVVLENWPLTSIRDLANGKIWDKKIVQVGGDKLSLNNIENDIIRKDFNEPRIHFAVNCAAKSCPPLRNEAFIPSKLSQQLEEQTRSFVQNTKFNKLGNGAFSVSKIFEWYSADFPDLKSFLKKYKKLPSQFDVQYSNYDWALNKK